VEFELWVEDEVPIRVSGVALTSAWGDLLGDKLNAALALSVGVTLQVLGAPEVLIARLA